MKNEVMTDFSVDKENNTIKIRRGFMAPLKHVWAAWTEKELLDQWWAPKPYRSETKTMEFREGGFRLYAMISPQGEKHWGREDYQKIDIAKSFTASKTFCDESGNVSSGVPCSLWNHIFSENAAITTVNIQIQYENDAHLEMMIKMGFKEGFTAILDELAEILPAMSNQ